jgi:MFS family permease
VVAVAGIWEEIRDGYREVRERAWVWATLIAFSLAQLTCLAPLLVLGPLVAHAQYGRTGVYGAIIAVFGVGTVVGSLAGIRYRPRHPLRTGLLAVLSWPAATVLYALGVTLFAVVPAMAIAGVGVALFDVCWTTALAERIPPDKLSRVSAYDWLVSAGLVPVGFVLAGPAVDAFGAAAVLTVGSAIAAVAIAAALAPAQTRRLERLEAA